MVESKTITNKLTEFNKILDDLVNNDVEIEDEGKTLLLLCELTKSFFHFKDTMFLKPW